MAITLNGSGASTFSDNVSFPNIGRRNLIINGAMQVAQRGTSFTSGTYTLDRWRLYNSGGAYTLSQQTFSSGQSPVFGAQNYMRLVRSSPSGTFYFSQRVEDVRLTDDQTLTFSFYAKASAATTVPCRVTQEFGSGGSSGVNITAQDANLTTSWQRFSFVFDMASLSGKTIGTGSYFEPVFDIPATTATIEITGVQLEAGSVATPFEHRSYGEELALCQRYFYKHSGTPSEGRYSYGGANFHYFYPVEMRSQATISGANVSTNRRFKTGVTFNPYTGDLGLFSADAEL